MCHSEMRDFGEKLKEYRKNKGLTQEMLANIIGVQNSAISKYEKGRIKQIPLHILARLKAVLEFSIKEIPISQFKELPPNTQTSAYLPGEYKKRLALTESYLHLLFSAPNPQIEDNNAFVAVSDNKGNIGYFQHFYIDGESFFILSKNAFDKKDFEQIKTYIQFLISQNENYKPLDLEQSEQDGALK